ncbi:hypothetical protein MSAN_02063400 [Mycena sanguinolenta]|uniref:Uncharacterized protein n=1 Tax=Mycena sanguinolenta TaxID=230812 RepID=A0A8H6XJ80_9AGAR|nr:hypothetical protein MSAN_02063400 [Mycena sanguinolenta]
MQIGLAAVAFALSCVSAVAAQASAASASFISSATPVAFPTAEPKILPKLVGAIIGGTVSGTIIVVVAVLFLVRYRMRRMVRNRKLSNTVAQGDAELGRRFDQLESEVCSMREQLDNLEAHRVVVFPGYGTDTEMYTHEKDITMFKPGVDVKDEKVYPPTYTD